jgi:uncharacterized protein (TIGR00288 family)
VPPPRPSHGGGRRKDDELNPWWLRPTAEGAEENPREADAGPDEGGAEKAGGDEAGRKGDRRAAAKPAASRRGKGRGDRSRQAPAEAEKTPAAGKAARAKKSDEPEKSGKPEKSGTPEKSGKAEKSGTPAKTGQTGKPGRSSKTDESEAPAEPEKAGGRAAKPAGAGRSAKSARADAGEAPAPRRRSRGRAAEATEPPAKPAARPPAAERSRGQRDRGGDEPAASPNLTFDDDITPANFAELRRELDSPPERNRPVSDELKIAMFCDLENIAIGVRDSAIKKFDINLILERLLEKGKIIVKKAYCDWERYSDYKRPFHEAAIEMIEIPQKHYSGKNSADIKMVVDAMDLCYSKEHLDTFVIVSGDSDFSPLVSKLKENDKTVIGVGVKDASSALLIANCDEFIYYEDIWRDRQSAPTVEAPDKKKSEAFRLMVDAMQALSRENKDVLWGSMIKQTMQRKKPSFNEGYYGYSTFSDLLEDAERNNLIKLKKDQRSGTYIVTGFSGRGGR